MKSLPDFSKCVEFRRLRLGMGVDPPPVLPPVEIPRKIIHTREGTVPNPDSKIEKTLEDGSIDIDLSQLTPVAGGFLIYKGRKVAAYIRDQRWPIERDVNGDWVSRHRYHVCDCTTLEEMRENGRENRYLVTRRTDGWFEVCDTSVDQRPTRRIAKMELCLNCVKALRDRGFYSDPFSLEEFLRTRGSDLRETIRPIEDVPEIQIYAPDHAEISRKYREKAGYKCQLCGVICCAAQYLLHLHHCDGDKSNYQHENLRVLCFDCHSRQFIHDHMRDIREHPEAPGLLRKISRMRKAQGILDLGLDLLPYSEICRDHAGQQWTETTP